MKTLRSISLALALLMASVANTYAQSVVIPAFNVNLTASSITEKGHTETYSQRHTVVSEVEVNVSATSTFVRQGRTLGFLTVTVGDESQTYTLVNGAVQAIIPAHGDVQVVITVTLTAAAGLGSASITTTDTLLTLR